MWESGDQYTQEQEIVENQKKNKQQESTIEDALKKKLPNSPEKQQLFLDIFKNPKITESFTQKDIIWYIQQKNLSRFWNTLKTKSSEEQKKMVIEDIDMYFKYNGGLKEIKIYNNILLEKDKQVTEKDKQVTKSTNQGIEKNKKITESTNQGIEIKNARTNTQKSYENLDKTKYIKPTPEEKNTIKNSITGPTLQKLQQNNLDLDSYVNFVFTAEKYSTELKTENNEFLINFQKLNKTLDILPIEIPFSETSNPKNTDDITSKNKSLSTTADNLDISSPTLPETKDFDTEFSTYVKFISDEKIKANIEKNKILIKTYKDIYDKDQEDARDEKWEIAYREYIQAITTTKETLSQRTQQAIKQRVMGTCITGLARYFDTTTINQDNFADDFDINTQDGFQVKKGEAINETNDDILYINGNMHGNTIGFYYNLTNPEAQLQSDDFLHFDERSETFSFGKNTWGKNNLGIKLPTLDMLSTQAQQTSEKTFDKILEKSKNIEELETTMKEQISTELLKNYWQEAIVKTRVERDIEKNITIQTVNKTFVPETVLIDMNTNKTIDDTTEKKARKLLEIRDKSTENMRSDELRRLRSLIERLDPLINKEKHTNLEPSRETTLKNIKNERSTIGFDDQRWKETTNFFQKFSKNNEINLEDLDTFITALEKEETISKNISKFSPDFQTEKDKEDADSLLENI